ncbi:MepB family protein [Reichenbachiella sp.]|uniref:MepB family protein n=1 Tax=Reichenbachiella sp. TaxID=2184521 RepID=UPI003B5ADE38
MSHLLSLLRTNWFDAFELKISSFIQEAESQEYGACRFEINGKKVISRNAKVTPKKIGQFVTVWKRSAEGITIPFEAFDDFDLLIINVKHDDQLGQFIFPKSVLIEKGIITSDKKEGKRGFRVYPPWDQPISKQATTSQKWQLVHFLNPEDAPRVIQKAYQIN